MLANLAGDLPAVLRSAPCECPVSVPIRVRARYVREKVKDPTVHATAAQRLACDDRPGHAERVLLQASNPPSASCGRSSRLRAAAFKAFISSGFSRLSTELPNPRHWACEYAGHKEKDASLERGEAGEDSPSALSPLEVTGPLRSLSSAVAGAQIFNTAALSLGKRASANEFGHATLCCARLRFCPRGRFGRDRTGC